MQEDQLNLRGNSQANGALVVAAIAAVLFSAKAIVAKFLYQLGADATTILALRLSFAGPVFAVIAMLQWRSARLKSEPLSWRDVGVVWLLGFLGYYLASFLDFAGLAYIPAAFERLILFLTPTIVALIGFWFYRKPLQRNHIQALVISYFGVLLVFWDQLQFAQTKLQPLLIGSALCFGASISYSLYMVLSGEIVRRIGSLRLVAYAMCVSSVLTALHCAAVAKQAVIGRLDAIYYWSALNAVLCTILPVYLTMFAIGRIGAAKTSQLSMIGPISLLPLGYFLLHEPVSYLQLGGTIFVLLGIARITASTPQLEASK